MNMVMQKNILLCVTGGIAVYKAAALTSKLTQEGANVKVMMSPSAMEFVSPLTFQSLSRNKVYIDTFDEKDPAVIAHIDVADWADLVVIAPATANIIGKLANGIADEMISTTLLATTAPVWIAPAMNVHMYDHPIVKNNIQKLADIGYQFIEPNEGYLACGYVGKGRLEEPEMIIARMKEFFSERKQQLLEGKNMVITAGPTIERIDPVRYLTNRSTGKMGYAIAEEAAKMGANVTLVSSSSLQTPPNVQLIQIETAEDMYHAVMSRYEEADIVIKAAAVADYRPKVVHAQKMKKKDGDLMIEMERTKDILKELGQQKHHQFLVGFAAETENVEFYAKKKIKDKNADMIVANNVSEPGAGFGKDTNIVTIYKKDGTKKSLPLLSKNDTAKALLREIVETLKEV